MVKFTKELKYNAIEEWRAHYVKYAQLKKLIYGEEKQQVAKTTTSGRKSGDKKTNKILPHCSCCTCCQWQHPQLPPSATAASTNTATNALLHARLGIPDSGQLAQYQGRSATSHAQQSHTPGSHLCHIAGDLSRHSSDFARRSGDFSRLSGDFSRHSADLTRPSGDVEELLEPILEEGSNMAFVQLMDDELERIHIFYTAKVRAELHHGYGNLAICMGSGHDAR